MDSHYYNLGLEDRILEQISVLIRDPSVRTQKDVLNSIQSFNIANDLSHVYTATMLRETISEESYEIKHTGKTTWEQYNG